MTDQVRRALNVYSSLSDADKKEFIQEIGRIEKSAPQEKRTILEELKKGTRVSLGPIAGGCPYCGR